MALNRALAAELDACAMLAHTAQEVRDVETSVAVVSAWCDDVGGGEVAVDGRDELGCELCEVASDDGSEFSRLVA